MPTPKTRNSIVAVLLFGLLAWLPFVRRPLSVDDHAIYQQAIYLSHDFARPYQNSDRGMGWTQGQTPSENNPPLYLYAQATVVRLFGAGEWKAHALQLVLNFAGAFAFFFLARRFTRYPLWATGLWIFTPHFLLTANAILVDAVLPPLMLLGLYGWIRGWEEKKPLVLALAAILLGLAPLAKYTGVLVWAVAAVWTVSKKPRGRDARWLFLLIPFGMFVGWMDVSARLYGASHVVRVAGASMVKPTLFGLLTILEFTSGTTWAIVVAVLTLAIGDLWLAGAGAAAGAVLVSLVAAFGFPLSVAVPFGGWAAITVIAGAAAVPLALRETENAVLLAWAALGLAGLWVARGWFCARYLVIVGPALVLLVVNILTDRAPLVVERPVFRGAVLAALIAGALVFQHADYRRAVIDRDMARTLDAWITARHDGGVAYYPADNLSGLGFYLDKSGLWRPAEPEFHLAGGDFCVAPARTVPIRFMPKMSAPTVVEKIEIRSRNPFRAFDFRSSAGFYGSIWAPLPFSLSMEPVEVYYIFRETNSEPTPHAG